MRCAVAVWPYRHGRVRIPALLEQANKIAMKKTRLLFVAEGVTLAHVARPLLLSAAVDPGKFETSFACDPRCQWLFRDFTGRYVPLWSLGSDHFLAALDRGTPLYSEAILQRYVRDDLRLLDEVRPDAVIGDFRLSLSVSARLAGIPYVAISNCYWSPYWRPPRSTVPNLSLLTGILPLPLADALFQLTRPIAFALHCRPLNRVRRRHGLPSLGSDLRRVYTDADHVLYADVPELFPGTDLPAHHHFIGPLVWSPPVPAPDWWGTIPSDRPIVYLTLGSSGQATLLPEILRSLAGLDITVIAATAGGKLPDVIPANAYVAQYIPGEEAARRACLVICNGGSPTSQQALAAGTPVIGISSNLDQFLNMGTLVHARAGEIMRADRFKGSVLAKLVAMMVSGSEHRDAARRLADIFTRYNSGERFAAILRQAISRSKDSA